MRSLARALALVAGISYTPTPTNIGLFADFMQRTGLLKHKVHSWKEVFFDNVHGLPGD